MNSTTLDTAALDRVLSELRENVQSWTDAPLAERIGLLERLMPRIADAAAALTAAGEAHLPPTAAREKRNTQIGQTHGDCLTRGQAVRGSAAHPHRRAARTAQRRGARAETLRPAAPHPPSTLRQAAARTAKGEHHNAPDSCQAARKTAQRRRGQQQFVSFDRPRQWSATYTFSPSMRGASAGPLM
ncbi:hypothetical protein [Streptomyces sp. NPDC005131]